MSTGEFSAIVAFLFMSLYLLSACGNMGSSVEECRSHLQNVELEEGEFAITVARGSRCNFVQGEAAFTPEAAHDNQGGRMFWTTLRVLEDEGIQLHLAQREAEPLAEGAHEVADISGSNRVTTQGLKVSAGGNNLLPGDYTAGWSQSGSVSVQSSNDKLVVGSIDLTITLCTNEKVHVKGRFKATRDSDVAYTLFSCPVS